MAELRASLARCPVPLTDDALDDFDTYSTCKLPEAVARLVRNDYADDALEPPDLERLRRHAGQVPRSRFELELRRFVDPGGALAGYAEVDALRGLLRPDPVLAPSLAIPFAPEPRDPPGEVAPAPGRLPPPLRPDRPYRPARRAEILRRASPERPLLGLRVVLDPGHAGGPWGAMEERRTEGVDRTGTRLVVQEGDLTLRTAREAREKLRALGAEVLLTREAPGMVHPYPPHWFRPYGERLLRRVALDPGLAALSRVLAPEERVRLRAALALLAVKKQMRFESLRWRARVAERAGADLVLSIHFNAARDPERAGPQQIVAMVRGFHAAARLYNPHHRWRALEEAFAGDDLAASAHMARLCVLAVSARLSIPPAGETEERYPDHLPLRDGRGQPVGVDVWDGALLRELDGPAALVEGPCQNDVDELPALATAMAAPLATPGTRVERYADGLAECVRDFAARWLGSERNPFGPFP